MAEFTKKLFKKGDVIIRQGHVEMCMYDIIIGTVGVYLEYGTPDEQLVAKLTDGEYFGEMELITVRSRSATVVALEPTECLVIDRETFGDYIRHYPEKCLAIMQSLSDKLRKANDAYMEMCKIAREAQAEEEKEGRHSSWLARLLNITQ